jgi:hypothetical protein
MNTTTITITKFITKDTPLFSNSGSTHYIKTGSTQAYIGVSRRQFLRNNSIQIYVNNSKLCKPVIVWNTPYSFSLPVDLDPGDILQITSAVKEKPAKEKPTN